MKSNILILSAGRRVRLTEFFRNSLTELIPGAQVYCADHKPERSPACLLSNDTIQHPRFEDAEFDAALRSTCEQYDIGMVIPTIDEGLEKLATLRNQFLVSGVKIITAESDLVKICCDKRLTNEFFQQRNIQTANRFCCEVKKYPIFIRPIYGSGSIDCVKINNAEEFEHFGFSPNSYVFDQYYSSTEYDEFTIDLYYSENGHLLGFVPRQRLLVRSGEVCNSVTEFHELFDGICGQINHIEGMRGVACLQLLVDRERNSAIGIEINPRFGGGYPLTHLSGANFTSALIKEHLLNEVIAPEVFSRNSGCTMFRYESEVFRMQYDDAKPVEFSAERYFA